MNLQNHKTDIWYGGLVPAKLGAGVEKLLLLANYDLSQPNNFTILLEYELVCYSYSSYSYSHSSCTRLKP